MTFGEEQKTKRLNQYLYIRKDNHSDVNVVVVITSQMSQREKKKFLEQVHETVEGGSCVTRGKSKTDL